MKPFEITYRGKMHHATALPTRTLPSDIVAYDPNRYAGTSDEDEEFSNHDGWEEDDSEDDDDDEDDYDDY